MRLFKVDIDFLLLGGGKKYMYPVAYSADIFTPVIYKYSAFDKGSCICLVPTLDLEMDIIKEIRAKMTPAQQEALDAQYSADNDGITEITVADADTYLDEAIAEPKYNKLTAEEKAEIVANAKLKYESIRV